MGTFSAPISIGSPDGERWTQVDALVDTGASIASAPASVLRGLGVEPLRKERFTFAQGETREMDVGQTWVRVGDREVITITLALFNEDGTEPLLGALALEGVFMGVDPVGKRLVPVGGWMAQAHGASARNGVGSRFAGMTRCLGIEGDGARCAPSNGGEIPAYAGMTVRGAGAARARMRLACSRRSG